MPTKTKNVRPIAEPIKSPYQYNPITKKIMANKDITLTTAERVYAGDLLTLWKGNVLTDGPALMEGAKAIILSADEQKEINFRAEGQQRIWDEAKSPPKEVSLNSETCDYLLKKMKERDEANETGFLEINIVTSLRDKLS